MSFKKFSRIGKRSKRYLIGTKGGKHPHVVSYQKRVGGIGFIVVLAKNSKEAIINAKNLRFTGKNFKFIK